MQTETGKVKWFSDHKGYGFIETPASQVDVFVHFSEIEMDGYKSLKPEMRVAFEMRHGERGPSAHRVSRLRKALSHQEVGHAGDTPHAALHTASHTATHATHGA